METNETEKPDPKNPKVVKTIMIQAVPPPGFSSHGEAHRLWPAGTPTKVDVLDSEDDGPEVPVRRTIDGATVIQMAPNPTVIGQRSLRAIQNNPRTVIIGDGDMVNAKVSEMAANTIAERDAEIVALKGEVRQLETENDTLLAENAQLKAAIGGQKTAAPAAGSTTPETKKDDGAGSEKKDDGKKDEKKDGKGK